MSRSRVFSTVVVLMCAIGPTSGTAGEKPGLKAPANGDPKTHPTCHKTVSVKGRPHRINAVANLNAVRMWAQKAMKHGQEYTMWHNAQGASVNCQKLPRSDYILCLASARPCRGGENQTTASAKAE